jgi:hypothetical protein
MWVTCSLSPPGRPVTVKPSAARRLPILPAVRSIGFHDHDSNRCRDTRHGIFAGAFDLPFNSSSG